VSLSAIQLHEQLGEGASGVIYRATWLKQPVTLQGSAEQIAVKLFKGGSPATVTPLMNCKPALTAGNHPNLVGMTAHIAERDQLGLGDGIDPQYFL